MLKATGGGGGLGLQVCNAESDVQTAFSKVKGRAESLFGNTGVFLEKYFPSSRHVEVQVFGNGQEVVHFGERECSIQRRHQKVYHANLFRRGRGIHANLCRLSKNVQAHTYTKDPRSAKASPNTPSCMLRNSSTNRPGPSSSCWMTSLAISSSWR